MVGQNRQATGEQIARGLVARYQQLDQEHGELCLAQLPVLGAGILGTWPALRATFGARVRGGQNGDQVVGRGDPARVGHADQVLPHLALQTRAHLGGVVALAGDDRLGPLVEAGPLLPVDAQQLTDDLEWEGDGERRHDIDRLPGVDAIDQDPRLLGDAGLHEPHHRWLEAGLDQTSVARVLGRVGVHHGRRGVVGAADLVDQDPPFRAEGLGISADGSHLGMGGDGPEATPVPGHGMRAAQRGIQREGVARLVQRGIGQLLHVGTHGCHGCTPITR